MDAVKGLASINVDEAIPVVAMSVGKVNAASVMRFWWMGGIVVAN